MSTEMTLIITWLLGEIVVFWVVLIILFVSYYRGWGILEANLDRQDLIKDRENVRNNQRRELELIDKDLIQLALTRIRTSKTERDLNLKSIELVEQGLALNQTLAQEDSDNEDLGDHWLSGVRWLWFAIYQFLLGFPIAWFFGFFTPATEAASIGFAVTIMCLIIWAPFIVREKNRAAVDRFGRWVSFLSPGLQFRVPIIESADEIILKNLVWGPGQNAQGDPSETDEFHLGGITGIKNPGPGEFKVLFHATYEGDVTCVITLRIRRSHRSAWYWWAYEFDNPNEIGEQIAAVTQAILTTKAREIDEDETRNDSDVPVKVRMQRRLRRFLDAIPEITGDILKALHQLSQDRLGGILPISIVITSVNPPKEFTNLLLRLDTAAVNREVEELGGMGTADRLNQLYGGEKTNLSEQQKAALRDYDISLRVAESGNVVDTAAKAFVLPLVNQLMGKPDGTQKK